MTGALCGNSGVCPQQGSDVALLKLLEYPPAGTQFLGWNLKKKSVGNKVILIHHPVASFKRISFGKISTQGRFFNEVNYIRGTTEGGSSGAPVLNQRGQVIGVHSYSYKGSPNQKACSHPRNRRGYARFSMLYPYVRRYLEDQIKIFRLQTSSLNEACSDKRIHTKQKAASDWSLQPTLSLVFEV